MIYLPVSVRPYVRPSAPFPIGNVSISSWIFFSNFPYILLSGMSDIGILMGKTRPFLTELLHLFILVKLFLAYYSFTICDISMKLHSYVYHQRFHIVTKNHHSNCSSSGVICLDRSEKCFLTCSFITIWNF